MTVLEQLRKTIEDGHPGETEKLVREALKQHIPAGRIVEEAMTPAMRTVGENYKSNGADIIKILAAARSVRKGFELLEEQDAQFSRRNIGTVILGTVEGDLHDVGKNLVAIMFKEIIKKGKTPIIVGGTGLAVWQEEYRNCNPWNGGR